MRDYDLDDLLIDEDEAYLSNPMELHYASYENIVKVFVKNYKNSSKNYLIEFGAALGFALFFYAVLKSLRPIWWAYGNAATFGMLFLAAIVVFVLLDLFLKHYVYKFKTEEVNNAMKMIFRILDENNIRLTDELTNDLLEKIHAKRDFNQLIQSAVIASAIFGLVASVFDYFTNMRDPTVEMNPGLYIEVLALSLFTLGSAIAVIVSIYALLTDMRKRILFNEVVEAINLNRHIERRD